MPDIDNDLGECIALPEQQRSSTSPPRQPLRTDVRWDNVDHLMKDADDVTLAPLDPEVEENRAAIYESNFELKPVIEVIEPPRYQFTIREILVLNTVLAVFLALLRVIAPSWVAGTLGIVTLLAAVAMAVCQPENRRVEIAWWCMLLVYIATCGYAIYG